MNKAYRYRAVNGRGDPAEGVVYADNRHFAMYRLRQAGLRASSVRFDLAGTVDAAINGGKLPKGELARFYQAIGRRLEAGKPIQEGLSLALEYLSNAHLKQAIVFMRQALLDGNSAAVAMQIAGFPRNDCMVVKAAAEAGGAGKAYLNLAAEYTREGALAGKFKKILFMPTVMLALMMLIFYASVSYLGPHTIKFLDNLPTHVELKGFVANFFELVKAYEKNPTAYTWAYVAACVALFWFLRSRYFRKYVLDRFKVSHNLSLKADLATLWGGFAMLYEAGLPVKDACRVLSDAAKREDVREWFLRMGKSVDNGRTLSEAVVQAGFPAFVVSGVKAATEEDSLSVGLANMVDNLRTELEFLSEKAAAYIEIGSIAMTAVGVGGVFMVTYYPMVSAALQGV